MPLTLSKAAIPQLERTLRNLPSIIGKAEAHAQARKIEPEALLTMRLYPDMFPLTRQVQTATDFAKAIVFRLTGRDPPQWENSEKSFAELKQRIERTLSLLASTDVAAIDGCEDRQITFSPGGRSMTLKADDYLFYFAMPNFSFHVTAAYAILRHAGVELGKADFIGPLSR